jgi:hypothetical protein
MGLLGVLTVGFLAVGQGNFFDLPLSMQRAISFVPGRWDAVVVNSSESSNDFRKIIKDIYVKEYLHKSPLLGNGFNYKKSDLYALDQGGGIRSYNMTDYDFHKGFVLRKDFHIGWISLYDTVGVTGGGIFILLFFVNCHLLGKSFFCFPRRKLPPVFVWVVVSLGSSFASFFAVSGAFQHMLPHMCILSALTWLIYEHAKELKSAKAAGNEQPTTS